MTKTVNREDQDRCAGLGDEQAESEGWSDGAISQFYRQYAGSVSGYIRRRFGAGPPDPEDITQWAFEKILKSGTLPDIENMRAYVYKTAFNVALTHIRKAARNEVTVDSSDTGYLEISDDLTPERVLIAKERTVIMKQTITNMPVPRRQSFILHRVHGLSCAEIARRTGYSESAIKKHIRLAMEDLNHALRTAEKVKEVRK